MPLFINGEVIDDAALHMERDLVRQSIPADTRRMEPHHVAEWVNRIARQNIISRVLLNQEARRSSILIPAHEIGEELKRRRGNAQSTICGPGERQAVEQKLRIDRLLAGVTRTVQRPGREELHRYYTANLSQFAAPERIHVLHIVKNLDETPHEDKLLAVLSQAEQELQRGKPFAWVANRYSDCNGNGGNLGWIARGEMVKEFDVVVFSLKIGEISAVFRTCFGFHLAQIVARKDAGVQDFEEIRVSLAARVFEARKQAAITAFLEDLARKADIRAFPAVPKAIV